MLAAQLAKLFLLVLLDRDLFQKSDVLVWGSKSLLLTVLF
jgi:hypothetical protein